MNKRPRFSDPKPANVTIPAPPGHRRSIEVHGGGLIMLRCQCGWRSLVLPQHEAEVAYDRHIESYGDWCDFCGGLWPIAKTYACEDFEVDFGMFNQKGDPELFVYREDWMACAPCAELVDTQQWVKLAVRCVETTAKIEVGPVGLRRYRKTQGFADALARVVYLHQCFHRHRKP